MRRVVPLPLALLVLAAGVALGASTGGGDGVVTARATPGDDVAHPGSLGLIEHLSELAP